MDEEKQACGRSRTQSELRRHSAVLEDMENDIPPLGELLNHKTLSRVAEHKIPVGMAFISVLECRQAPRSVSSLRVLVANDLLPCHRYRWKSLESASARKLPSTTTARWKAGAGDFRVPVSWSDKRVVLALRGRTARWALLGTGELDLSSVVEERVQGEGSNNSSNSDNNSDNMGPPDVHQWVAIKAADKQATVAELEVKVWYRHGYDQVGRPVHAPSLNAKKGRRSIGEGEGESERNEGDDDENDEDEGGEGQVGEDGNRNSAGAAQPTPHGQDREEQPQAGAEAPQAAPNDNNNDDDDFAAPQTPRMRRSVHHWRVASFKQMRARGAPPPKAAPPNPLDTLQALIDNKHQAWHVRAAARRLLDLWGDFKTGDLVLYSTPPSPKKGVVECAANRGTRVITGSPYTHVAIVVVAKDEGGHKHVMVVEATVNGDRTPDYLQSSPNRQCIFCFNIVDRLKGSSGLDYLPLKQPLSPEKEHVLQRFLCKEWLRDPEYDDKDFIGTGVAFALGQQVANLVRSAENWDQFMCSELVGASLKFAFTELEHLNMSKVAPASFLDRHNFPMLDHDRLGEVMRVPNQQ